MKLRKLLATLSAVIGLVWVNNASATIVGGVDFGNFASHLETTTVSETLLTGDGQTLIGYGSVDRVNGDLTYCAVDANCRLFFTFTGYLSQAFTGTSVQFTGGLINVYYDPNGLNYNFLSQSSPTNLAYIQGLTEWVQLAGHGNLGGGLPADVTLFADGTLVGSTISFTGQGLLDVVLGAFGLADVQNYWNSNGTPDAGGGFADIALGTEGNNQVLNPNDTCTGQAGQFCIQGTASIRGVVNVVPEPGSLAMMGLGLGLLGLLGVGGFGRRRRT